MCGSVVDIQFAAAEIRRGKKKKIEDRRKKPQGKNIMSTSAMQGGHNYYYHHSTVIIQDNLHYPAPQSRTEEFAGAKFYHLHVLADGN